MKQKDKQSSIIIDKQIGVKLITNTHIYPTTHFLWQDKINKVKHIEISKNKILLSRFDSETTTIN